MMIADHTPHVHDGRGATGEAKICQAVDIGGPGETLVARCLAPRTVPRLRGAYHGERSTRLDQHSEGARRS